MNADPIALLETIAAASAERQPLGPALRASGLAHADTVADRLDRGATLPEALAGAIDRAIAAQLAGPLPPLDQAALLAAAVIRRHRLARAATWDLLAWPLLSAVLAGAVALTVGRTSPLLAAWIWPAAFGLLLTALAAASLLPWGRRLPLFGRWRAHAVAAHRWERAALAARWRLDEATLAPLLGHDLAGLGTVLAARDAEPRCRRLAEHHAAASARWAKRLGLATVLGIHLLAAAVVIAGAAGVLEPLLTALTQVLADAG